VSKASATFGLPGDRENLVSLQADHSRICKFGPSNEDQDNLELVLANIQDLYEAVLEKAEKQGEKGDEKECESPTPRLPSAPSTDPVGGDKIETRFITLRGST